MREPLKAGEAERMIFSKPTALLLMAAFLGATVAIAQWTELNGLPALPAVMIFWQAGEGRPLSRRRVPDEVKTWCDA